MTCNLLLIAQPDHVQLDDFNLLAQEIRTVAPDVHAYAIWDQMYDWRTIDPALDHPTLPFSPVPVRFSRPWRAPLFQGIRLHKSKEYRALEEIGIPLPRWGLLTQDLCHCFPNNC